MGASKAGITTRAMMIASGPRRVTERHHARCGRSVDNSTKSDRSLELSSPVIVTRLASSFIHKSKDRSGESSPIPDTRIDNSV